MRDPRALDLWISWLHDLGGSYTPMLDLEEKKPLSGRRDPDKRARQYELGEDYAINSNGSVIRL